MRRFPTSSTAAPGWVSLFALLTGLPTPAFAQSTDVAASGSVQLTAPEAASAEASEQARERDLRVGSTYYGTAGGIYVVDAGSSAPESFRLQLMTDFLVKKDFLYNGDKNRYTGGVLSLSVAPVRFFEFSAAVTTRTNSNTRTEPEVLSAVGDLHFDVKGFYEFVPGITLGADGSVSFLNGPGDLGVDFAGTSFGLRANFAVDLQKLAHVPLKLRLNAGHLFDNSTEMVEDLESARFANLVESGISGATSKADEYRHLVRRDERLALGINRVDRTVIAVGAELPLSVGEHFGIHPILEWDLAVPVNRRGFDCPYVTTAGGEKLPGSDSCLKDEGVDTWPQRLTAGVRMYPWLPGLNVLAGVEVGLGGTTNFVQELAPTAPYKVLLALGYTADVQRKKPVVREVEKVVEVATAKPVGRVLGRIVEQGQGTAVADARVSFAGKDLNPILATADGKFASYAFEPGAVDMNLEAEGYQPGTCTGTIAEAGGDVAVTCELVALPRVGSITLDVVGENNASMANTQLALSGPESRTVSTDATGRLHEANLPAGTYTVRIEQPGYLISVTQLEVKVRTDTPATVQLVPLPKTASVAIKKDRIQIKGSIYFTTGTADIEGRSEPLLTEIADVLIRNPDITRVEVQGHTDDTGKAELNQELSQKRAEAVTSWLSKAGVLPTRLVAKGYGSDKPIVPNVTAQGRSRNRRVEFVILERSAPVEKTTP